MQKLNSVTALRRAFSSDNETQYTRKPDQSPFSASKDSAEPIKTSRGFAEEKKNLGSRISSATLKAAQPERRDDITRAFNTAIVATQTKSKRDFSTEICDLTQSAPFKAILSAARQLASIHGISERQASEQIIQTFRKLDRLWSDYLFREGLDKLRNQKR